MYSKIEAKYSAYSKWGRGRGELLLNENYYFYYYNLEME